MTAFICCEKCKKPLLDPIQFIKPEDVCCCKEKVWNCHAGVFHQEGCPHKERKLFEARGKTDTLDEEITARKAARKTAGEKPFDEESSTTKS